MNNPKYPLSAYLITGMVGAILGGIAVLIFTRAIPTMMSRMMGKMMENMMKRMGSEGCNPEEM